MKKFLASNLFRFIWSAGLAIIFYLLCPPCFSKTTIAIVLLILLVLVNGSKFISKAPILTHIARFLVGGLFIFSGFIKANDPLGFSYKLQEYFEVFKADSGMAFFEWFAHISLPLAIIICASEIILGVMLLIGYKRDLTLWLLLAQIVFFTFLTFYSACYNKVTHCGCFGDFIKLKPWESFWKDIALMILITLLFAGKENIRELFSPMILSTLFLMGVVFSVGFPIYAYRNLPPLDFRAYAPGMSIKENMKKGEGYQDPVYESMLVYKNLKNGSLKEFTQADYMKSKIWEDTLTWKWEATDNKLVKDAVNPPKITDFTVNTLDGVNITDSLLNDKNYSFWLVIYETETTDEDETLMAKIKDFYKLASEDHHNFIALSASSNKQIDEYKHKHNALFEFATVDKIVLKTMIRSNPGLMLVKDGKVIMNWHHNNIPTYSDVKQKYMN
jgi:uncharacterized membrane protein YphA (DoxX/SURF4 family)